MPVNKIIQRDDSLGIGYGPGYAGIKVDTTDNTIVYNADGTERVVVTTALAQTLTSKTLTSPIIGGDLGINDDVSLELGTDDDSVLRHKSATLATNTALTDVLLGTPVTSALAANSLIVSNTTAAGDILVAASRGGNSEEYLFIDASAGKLRLVSPADHLELRTLAAGKQVRINNYTSTDTTDTILGFQSKPGAGASTAKNVIGCEISPRVNNTFALTGTGTIIGAHIDTYLKGTTGNIAGHVRTLQLEAVTDDAGTRTVSGDVVMIRMRTAWSGTITGDFVPFLIELNETQTNSKSYTHVFKFPSRLAGVWHDDPTTEPSTAAGYIKVKVNGNARYIQLYSTAPTD